VDQDRRIRRGHVSEADDELTKRRRLRASGISTGSRNRVTEEED
jgi:hypothetical protein